ncbi:MAG TPA: hypothetical protein VEX86_06615 [Longimicrobium sp.]|nr:hypothetical protein [Longimicrobium sp.]
MSTRATIHTAATLGRQAMLLTMFACAVAAHRHERSEGAALVHSRAAGDAMYGEVRLDELPVVRVRAVVHRAEVVDAEGAGGAR